MLQRSLALAQVGEFCQRPLAIDSLTEQAQAELFESEKRFRQLVEGSPGKGFTLTPGFVSVTSTLQPCDCLEPTSWNNWSANPFLKGFIPTIARSVPRGCAYCWKNASEYR